MHGWIGVPTCDQVSLIYVMLSLTLVIEVPNRRESNSPSPIPMAESLGSISIYLL